MSWVRIWVHLVFSTKNWKSLLTNRIRKEVLIHIMENAKNKDIWLDAVGGYTDHIRCLISLGREQTISKVAQLIKGESSCWINRNLDVHPKFVWQDDYWAVSVSESHVEKVRNYIKNKEDHHKSKTFKEEIEELMRKHGFVLIKEH